MRNVKAILALGLAAVIGVTATGCGKKAAAADDSAKDTKKKIVSLEIYEYDNIIDIVISNTFNQKYNISNRNKKGFSTKGQGRGNGLYFASKLLSKNKWIIDSQEIYKDFYIQKLSITK